jgi:hypothetical protein
LAFLGLAKPIKDMSFQLEFNSLAHLVWKLTSYEQCHPDIYQDKFKTPKTPGKSRRWLSQNGLGRQIPCLASREKQQGPANGFDFDESKVEQIFDLLLWEKQLKLP